ncbi:FUSC family protein [Austwickia chelonae]|uniref:FUSC family protein n=1 Tax=Austwickia chelonae TaxID=100225 RepID=UPI0013C3408C|nr:FUSC family protein [Austwickia chelonae]
MHSAYLRSLRESLYRSRFRALEPSRLRRRSVPTLWTVTRLTSAAVLAYLLAVAVNPGLTDLTGPLTALLVVQTSLYATLKMGVFRILSVLTGVLVAIAVSTWVGLSWWSLGLVIAASLLIGSILRLGDNLLEAPISAMLILGVYAHDIAAETRVLNTLIGAGVGAAFSLLLPPSVAPHSAEEALLEVAEETAEAVRRSGREMAEQLDRRRVTSWLHETHSLLPLVEVAAESVAQVEENRRLNPRALVRADVVPILRSGVSTLDRTILSLRAMFQSLEDELPVTAGHPSARGVGYDDELRGAFSVVLIDMGDAIAAFGTLVVAEAEGRQAEAEEALAETLEILRETRAILTDLYFVDGRDNPSAWLLRGSVLASIEAVLRHLDVEERSRQRARRAESERARKVHVMPNLPRIPGVVRSAKNGQPPPGTDTTGR